MSLEDRQDDRSRGASGKAKKQYERPRLVAYGDIAAVTRAVGMSGTPDGGKGAGKATQP